MLQANSSLAELFRKQFALCKVKPGESAVIVAEPDSIPHYVAASFAALTSLGAKPFELILPIIPDVADVPVVERGVGNCTLLEKLPAVIEMLGKTDIIIDLTVEGLIHSQATEQILARGARMLYVREPADALARLMATADRTRRIARSIELLNGANTMLVTSKAGTNLKVDLEGAAVQGSWGFCDQPGRWANWGNGFVAAYPTSLKTHGDVVVAPGDILFPFKRYVERPIRFVFKDAFVETIEGEGMDAELVRDYMSRWNDRNAYGISHIGWGLHERALWHAMSLYGREEIHGVDGRAFEGNFLFSTGPNRAAGRLTACHLDIPIRNCSITLDNQQILVEGAIVEPSIMHVV